MSLAEANAIQQGNQVRLSVLFKNESGQPEDPTVVSCQIEDPTKKITTPTPTRDATGEYHYILTVGLPGRWQYRFAGTGTLVAAKESDFWVQNSTLI